MKPLLKSIDLNGVLGFEEFIPEDPIDFGVWLTVEIGPDNEDGGHLYQILVCSPHWIARTYGPNGIVWGRHMLIMFSFDQKRIVEKISEYLRDVTGSDFLEMAQKVARVGHWEFEDYVE